MVITGQVRLLKNRTRELSRSSPFALKTLVKRGIERHPQKISTILLKHLRSPVRLETLGERNLFLLIGVLTKHRQHEAAIALATAVGDDLCGPREQIRTAIVIARMKRTSLRIMTYHKTILVYDFGSGKFRHVTPEECDESSVVVPVRLNMFSRYVRFYVEAAGTSFTVGINQRKELTDMCDVATDIQSDFEVLSFTPGTLSFCVSGSFLCAEPGDKIVCDRRSASNWERFTLG